MKIIITSLIIGVLFGSSGAGRYKCPDGYVSNRYGGCKPSREPCQPGHYYEFDQCKACPCNNHEKSCEIDRCSRVHCNCRAGYTGKYCQNYGSTQIKLEKPLQVAVEPATQTVYRGFEEINVNCIVNDPEAQVMWLRNGQIYTDQRGQKVGRSFKIDKARDSDGGSYICLAIKGGKAFKAIASIKVIEATAPVARITPITDGKMKVPLDERVELTCNADGFRSHVSWQRISADTGAQEIIQSSLTSEVHHQILSMSEKTAGEYVCYAESPIGSATKSIRVEIEPLVLKVYPEKSQVVTLGHTVTLECRKPAAYPNVEVHWTREDGRPLESNAYQSPNGSLTIRNIMIKDEGHYNCSVAKGVLSASATVEIKVQTLPVIEIPQSTNGIISTKGGENVKLTCNADGHPLPNVQWRKFSDKTKSYETVQQAMTESAVYEIKSWFVTEESRYLCFANNSAGSSKKTVRLVMEDPRLKISPEGTHVVVAGNSVTLKCRETTGYSNFRISWRPAKGRSVAPNVQIANGSLTITDITINEAGRYTCFGTNGVAPVAASTEIEVITLPEVRIPQSTNGNITAKLGDKVTLTCNADGQPQPIVQWHTSKFPPTSRWYQIENRATPKSAVYEIESLSGDQTGLYVCVAKNSVGSSEKIVQVGINPPILEVHSNGSDVVVAGSSVTLECRESVGYSNMKIDWARDDNKPFARNVVELANGFLRITNITMKEEGGYKCSATNGLASASATTEIKVITLPVVEIMRGTDGSITEQVGDSVKLTCNAEGHPQPNVQWHKFSNKTNSYETIGEAALKSAVHDIPFVTELDVGLYLCLANNSAGSSNKTVRVYNPLELEVYPEESQVVMSGSSVTLECRESGVYSNIKFHWAREDDRSFASNVVQFANGSLTITNITINEGGRYKCSASNGEVSGSITGEIEVQSPPATEIPSTTTRNIIAPPKTSSYEFMSSSESGGEFQLKQTIKVSPEEQEIKANDESKIVCELKSLVEQTKIHLKWRRGDGLPISENFDVTDGVLEIYEPTKADSGEYICVALNSEGTELFRASSTLKVTAPPYIWQDEADEFVIGDNVTLNCRDTRNTSPTYSWTVSDRSLLPNEKAQGNLLTIQGFKEENKGYFCCEGQNTDGSDSHCRTVQPKAIEIITLSTSDVQVAVDGSVEVECFVVDKSGPKINLHWERSDHSSSSNVTTEEEGHLTLSKVTEMDSGIYVCRGLNAAGEQLARKKLSLQVIAPPGTIEITTDVSDNNDVTMTCEVSGDDLRYEWTAKEGDLLSNEEDSWNKLHINEVEKKNDRTFCCKASNIAGHLEKCKQLPTLLIISKSHSDVLADSPFEIDCQVLGTDASKIHTKWQRANHAGFSETTVKDHGLLKISKVLETDAGDYHCLGLGKDGTEHLRKTASLNVSSLPKVVFKINEANFKVGGTLSATCTATGGEITLELETDDKVLLPNEKIEGPVLTISNIPKNFERKYWCTASNDVGTTRTYIAPRIKKIEKK